jgi:hypothetical protein
MTTFNAFCEKALDGLYSPELTEQCSGYILLKKMLDEGIQPATPDETERWRTNPTQEELWGVPDLKYLQFLHPLLRPIVIENWDFICSLER